MFIQIPLKTFSFPLIYQLLSIVGMGVSCLIELPSCLFDYSILFDFQLPCCLSKSEKKKKRLGQLLAPRRTYLRSPSLHDVWLHLPFWGQGRWGRLDNDSPQCLYPNPWNPCLLPNVVYSFPRAAQEITINWWLKTLKFILSQCWRPEVGSQGTGSTVPSWKL